MVQTHPPPPFGDPHLEPVVEAEIATLLAKGAVETCSPCKSQFLSSVFLRTKPDGSFRFILNLKKLNKFIDAPHFKMENLKTALGLLSRGAHMATLDLKDAYYSIPVHPDSRKYLRFRFKGILYQFTCLPFGLNVSPSIFTKVLKPVVAHLRSLGFSSVIYLDDLLLLEASFSKCVANLRQTIALLESLGFTISYKKSVLDPSNSCKFLGFLLNSEFMTVSLPPAKAASLLSAVQRILDLSRISIEKFASVIGLLIAACPAFKYGFAHTKTLERCKIKALRRSNWNFKATMSISDSAKDELRWWAAHIPQSGNPVRSDQYDLTLHSDASRSGWGAHTESDSTFDFWSSDESQFHINYLELLAVFKGLQALAATRRDINILLRIDNTTTISYINKMGGVRSKSLYRLAREIWSWAESRNIFLFASYIRSSDNVIADRLSRLDNDDTEWCLSAEGFSFISETLGMPDIDLFASAQNAKCSKYVSWFPDKYAFDIDAFTINWSTLWFYAFPPFSLILRVLSKLKREGGRGIVVVPDWPNQPWYPRFFEMAESEPISLGPDIHLLLSPSRSRHPLASSLRLRAAVLSSTHF